MTLASKTQQSNSHSIVEFHWDGPRSQMHPLTSDVHLCKWLCFNSSRGKTPVNTIPKNQGLEESAWGRRMAFSVPSYNAGTEDPKDREMAWCLEIIGTSLCFHRWISENIIFLYFLLLHFTFMSQPAGIWLWHLESYYSLLWSPTDSHLMEEYTFNSGFSSCHFCHFSSLDPFHVALVTKQSLCHHPTLPPSLVSSARPSRRTFRFTSPFSYFCVYFSGTRFIAISDSFHFYLISWVGPAVSLPTKSWTSWEKPSQVDIKLWSLWRGTLIHVQCDHQKCFI